MVASAFERQPESAIAKPEIVIVKTEAATSRRRTRMKYAVVLGPGKGERTCERQRLPRARDGEDSLTCPTRDELGRPPTAALGPFDRNVSELLSGIDLAQQ